MTDLDDKISKLLDAGQRVIQQYERQEASHAACVAEASELLHKVLSLYGVGVSADSSDESAKFTFFTSNLTGAHAALRSRHMKALPRLRAVLTSLREHVKDTQDPAFVDAVLTLLDLIPAKF